MTQKGLCLRKSAITWSPISQLHSVGKEGKLQPQSEVQVDLTKLQTSFQLHQLHKATLEITRMNWDVHLQMVHKRHFTSMKNFEEELRLNVQIWKERDHAKALFEIALLFTDSNAMSLPFSPTVTTHPEVPSAQNHQHTTLCCSKRALNHMPHCPHCCSTTCMFCITRPA